nr:hypothetical protein [Dyella acidiphila]
MCGALALLAGLPALQSSAATRHSTSQDPAPTQLSIQVNNDRLTLAVAKAPQIYLAGVIDADAPQRFESMMRSGKIANGSDIYLNASGADLHAGIALGRLFRQGSMVTHLGTQRRQRGAPAKPALCTDACVYAYLGGLYRWAPTGADRIGFPAQMAVDPKASADPDDTSAYLKEMDIDQSALAPLLTAAHADPAWLPADQLIAARIANNGRLPLTATYQVQNGEPYLTLAEVKRGGQHRMSLECRRDGVLFTAYNAVGAEHAKQIVAHGARSFVEVNHAESYPPQQDYATVQDDAVVIARTYPGAQLGSLISATTLGAWVRDRNSMLRYGFEFELGGLDHILRKYYQACWEYAPWQVAKKS